MRFLKIVSLLLVITLISLSSEAQSFLAGKDLSTVKVDALTDAEIAQIQAQLQKSGTSIEMVESQAIAKGMSPSEFAKLKARLGSTKATKNVSPITKKTVNNKFDENTLNKEKDELVQNKINPLIYGAELFNNSNGFGENQNIATS